MTSKDIEKIYDDLENYLIRNIKKNLTDDLKSFHLKEEKAYGFDWEAWQSAKLRELKRYRRQNKEIVNSRLKNITSKIAAVLQRETRQGKLDAFKNFKEALTHGYKSSVKVKDSFFKLNDRKVNTLINSVNNDFKTANKAVLRQSNDVYRQIIAEASMYNQTGVMTEIQAIKKAVSDFEKRGINCIQYSNGSRHKISDYSKMAIRTASTRAYLQGEGEFRKKIGSTLVLMSKHNTACKLCQPWEGKVLIDDVYSGGTKEDGKYPLMSEAMKQGLYHPNCRHGHGTYYPELGKKNSNEIIEKIEKEQTKEEVKQPQKLDTLKKQADYIKSREDELYGLDVKTLQLKLNERAGFNNKPIVLSSKEFDLLEENENLNYNTLKGLKDGKYIKVYRGWGSKKYYNQFMYGKNSYGNAGYVDGVGTYATDNEWSATQFAKEEEDRLMEIAIPESAKFISKDKLADLHYKIFDDFNTNRDEYKKIYGDKVVEILDVMNENISSTAVLNNYDVIYNSDYRNWVLLNRSILRIKNKK